MSNRFAAAGIPVNDLKTVAAKIRGDASIPLSAALESATWVQGYALSFVPEGAAPAMATGAPVSDVELADHLEAAAREGATKHEPKGAAATATAIPWATILPVLLSLIQQWLAQRG